jgi:hypothetical protein
MTNSMLGSLVSSGFCRAERRSQFFHLDYSNSRAISLSIAPRQDALESLMLRKRVSNRSVARGLIGITGIARWLRCDIEHKAGGEESIEGSMGMEKALTWQIDSGLV